MAFQYTIQSGDNLSSIAKRYGLKSWREIYDLPENAGFRSKRPNPNLIFPGDVIMIPGDDPSGPTGKVRLCGRKEMPNVNPFGIPLG